MPDHRLVLVRERYNKHSLTALAGSLDIADLDGEWSVEILRGNHLIQELSKLTPCNLLVLGFSFHTPNAPTISGKLRSLRNWAHSRQQRVLLLAGGPHATGDAARTLAMGFDFVLTGEGESILPQFLRRVSSSAPLSQQDGLVYLDEDHLYTNPRPTPIDLDLYPPFSIRHGLFAPLEISRGCPGGCLFCQTPALMGKKMRHRSVDAARYWADIAHHHGMKDLRFLTPNSFAYGSPDGRRPNPFAVESLLRAVGAIFHRNHIFFGTFPSEVRPDSVTPEMVDLVKHLTANDNLILGAQSGSDRMLRMLHRGHNVDDVYRAVEIIQAAGLRVYVDFIFSIPGETETDRAATREMVKTLRNRGAIIHTHTFMPLPGTPLQDALPVRVDPQTRKLLRHTSDGTICGQWRKQEALAFQTREFMQSLSAEDHAPSFPAESSVKQTVANPASGGPEFISSEHE